MSTEEEKRTRWYNIRLKPDEYEILENRFKKTRFRKLSEYMRSVLLDKPITVNYRDKAMDEVLEELVLLRRELNAIGNNLNLALCFQDQFGAWQCRYAVVGKPTECSEQ